MNQRTTKKPVGGRRAPTSRRSKPLSKELKSRAIWLLTTRRGYAVMLCSVLSIVLALVMSYRVGQTRFTASLVVSRLTFETLGLPPDTRIRTPAEYAVHSIDRLSGLRVVGTERIVEGPVSLAIDPPEQILSGVGLDVEGTVTIDNQIAQGMSITVRNNVGHLSDPFSLVTRRARVSVNSSPFLEGPTASNPLVMVGSTDGTEGSTTAYLVPGTPALDCDVRDDPRYAEPNLSGIELKSVRFARVVSAESGLDASSIVQAVVSIPEIDREISLDTGEALVIASDSLELVSMHLEPCFISVKVRGTAQALEVGVPGQRTDARPTYFEYLMGNKNFLFFFTFIAGIWGFGWGIRELFVAARDE